MHALTRVWPIAAGAFVLAIAQVACGSSPPPSVAASEQPPRVTTPVPVGQADDGAAEAIPAATFVGRAWVSDAGADAAPGTVRVFLPDGTLLMDSCVEVYRLARWRSTGEGRIAWEEDTARVDAEILEASDQRLRLRLTLRGGETRDEAYRPAAVPFLCPDLR